MNNIMDSIATVWDSASIFERESFITRSCAELIIDMCDEREAKSLEVMRNNLAALTEFAENMQDELEARIKKDKISSDFSAICSDIDNKGFSRDIAERLSSLSEAVREYADEHPSEDECDEADDDAYSNIMAVMEHEIQAVNA